MPVLALQCLPHPKSVMLSLSFSFTMLTLLEPVQFIPAVPMIRDMNTLSVLHKRGRNLSFTHPWGGDFPGTA